MMTMTQQHHRSKTTFSSVTLTAVLGSMLIGLAGCGGESASSSNATGSTTGGEVVEATWLVEQMPGTFEPVGEAKQTAQEGDEVIVFGRIGGRVKPMEPGSPVFLIVDKKIPHCGEMGDDDHCPTPWDYCCEPPDSLIANSATVQLVDVDGKTLKADPIAAGLKPLDEILVKGTVGPRPSEKVLTIKATEVHVQTPAEEATHPDHAPTEDKHDSHS